MRLFIAINLCEKVKLKLIEAQNYLKKYSVYGNFTAPENLHLTLVFLGEIENGQIDEIRNAIDKISIKPFKICINALGRFKKDGGDIWWLGIKHSPSLIKLQKELLINLQEIGFNFSDKFSPHITIARQTSLRKDFDKDSFNNNFGNVYSEVNKISLMESTKPMDKIIYTEVYSKILT